MNLSEHTIYGEDGKSQILNRFRKTVPRPDQSSTKRNMDKLVRDKLQREKQTEKIIALQAMKIRFLCRRAKKLIEALPRPLDRRNQNLAIWIEHILKELDKKGL